MDDPNSWRVDTQTIRTPQCCAVDGVVFSRAARHGVIEHRRATISTTSDESLDYLFGVVRIKVGALGFSQFPALTDQGNRNGPDA